LAKALQTLLIKPAGPDCNLACTYCFYLDKARLFPETKTHRMSSEVLETTIRQAMQQSGEQIAFVWQGGEPTLIGLSFFQEAVELQQRYGRGHRVGNALQTNGLLLDEAWIDFFQRYHFLVGLSLDGPEHVHNRYRRTAAGQGSWRHAAKRARQLLKANVAVNALAVVNDYSVQFPEESYRFFCDVGLRHMQFVPCVEPHPKNPKQPADFCASPEAYGEFLCRLFDLWRRDFRRGVPTTFVRFFDTLFYRYVDREAPECTYLAECGVYLVVEHNGNVYPCDFVVEADWQLGNVTEDKLIDLLNGERQRTFGKMKAHLADDCRQCRWLDLCRGGCTRNRLPYSDPRSLNVMCRAYRMFFAHADDAFRELADDWHRRQRAQAGAKQKVGRNDPCPCGSGKKYKMCCGK